MQTRIPKLLPYVCVGDDPRLLAELSTILARRRFYLPLLDGPRLTRPDGDAEVIRRTNTIARLRPDRVVLAGLPHATCDLLTARLPAGRAIRVSTPKELLGSIEGLRRPTSELRWGSQHIGLGVLRALRNRQQIVFGDFDCPIDGVVPDANHVVICEEGDEHAQVLAATRHDQQHNLTAHGFGLSSPSIQTDCTRVQVFQRGSGFSMGMSTPAIIAGWSDSAGQRIGRCQGRASRRLN